MEVNRGMNAGETFVYKSFPRAPFKKLVKRKRIAFVTMQSFFVIIQVLERGEREGRKLL
jgi:hypothetical protein